MAQLHGGYGVDGGEVAEVIKIPSKISPAVNNDVLGRGLLVGAFRDNDW